MAPKSGPANCRISGWILQPLFTQSTIQLRLTQQILLSNTKNCVMTPVCSLNGSSGTKQKNLVTFKWGTKYVSWQWQVWIIIVPDYFILCFLITVLPSILPNFRTFSTAGSTWPRNQRPLVFANRRQHPTDQSTGNQWGWHQSPGCREEQTCSHTSEEKNRSAPEKGFSADNAAETGLAGTWRSHPAQHKSATLFLCRYCWERNSPGGLFCTCCIGLSDPGANPQRQRCLSVSHVPVFTYSVRESLGFMAPSCKTAPLFSCVWDACQRQPKKGATFACGPHAQRSGRPKLQAAMLIRNGRGEVDFCVLC